MAEDYIARAMAMDAANSGGDGGGTADTYSRDEIDKKLLDYVPNTKSISRTVGNLKGVLTSGFYRVQGTKDMYEDYPQEGFSGYDQMIVSRGGDNCVQILTSYTNPGKLAIRTVSAIGTEKEKWRGWFVFESAENFVKKTDYAKNKGEDGIVSIDSSYGINVREADNSLMIQTAVETDIDGESNIYKPVTSKYIPRIMHNYGIDSKTQIPDMQKALADVLHLGAGEVIPNGSDLDNYVNPGVWRTPGSAATATLINCPTAIESAIRLEVALTTTGSVENANGIVQKIFPNAVNGVFYMRTRSTSKGWGEWYKFDGTVAESRKQADAQAASKEEAE